MADDASEIDQIEVYTHGVVASRSLEPAVQLTFGDRKPITLPAAEARAVAMSMIEASYSAEQDASFVRYLTQEGGMSLAEAGAVLLALRRFREISGGGEGR